VAGVRIHGDAAGGGGRMAWVTFLDAGMAKTALMLDGMQVYDHVLKVAPLGGGGAPAAGPGAPGLPGGAGPGGETAAGGAPSVVGIPGGAPQMIAGPPRFGGGPSRSHDPERTMRTIHVGGIPMEDAGVNEALIAEFFKSVGDVSAVRISGRFAWVEFSQQGSAQQAMALDGQQLGSGSLRISQSKTPIHTAGWRKGQGMVGGARAPAAPRMAHVAPGGGFPQPGYPLQQGYPPQQGAPFGVEPGTFHQVPGYPPAGMPQAGMTQAGMPQAGMPQAGMPQAGYGYPPQQAYGAFQPQGGYGYPPQGGAAAPYGGGQQSAAGYGGGYGSQ